MNSKLSREEKILIIIQTLYFFASALASVFLSIYLFKLGGFSAVALFNLLTFLFLTICYIASGLLLKKISSRMLIIVSLIIFSFFWGILFFIKQSAIFYLIPLGILFGIGQGLFWSGINLTQYIVSHNERRNRYFSLLSACVNFFRGLAPILGGIIISSLATIPADGYGAIFFIVLLLNISTIFFAISLPVHKGVVFSRKQFFSHRTPSWKRVLIQQFILGLWDLSLQNLLGVILYLIYTNEFTVGTVNASLSIVAAGGAIITSPLLRRFPQSPVVAGISSGLGLATFAILQNSLGLIIFAVLTTFAFQVIAIPLASAIFTAIDHNPQVWQHKYHMLIERDAVLNFARSISFMLLWLAFTKSPKESVAPVWLTTIAIFPVILGWLVKQKSRNQQG